MPSLRMKTKFDKDSSRENNGLHVCKKSTVISKTCCSHVIDSHVTEYVDGFNHDFHPDLSSPEPFARNSETDEETISLVIEETSRFQKQAFSTVDAAATETMESNQSCTTDVETIFSPVPESTELRSDTDSGRTKFSVMADGTVENRSSYTEQSCNISDFFISDMIISNIPFEKSRIEGGFSETNSLPDYICTEPSTLFDVAEQYIILPYLEDQTSNKDSQEGGNVLRDEIDMYRVVRTRSNSVEDPHENFDPRFIKNMPELSDVVTGFLPDMLQKDKKRRKTVTLVLDLDETLVHSTLEYSEDADFTFSVFFNMEEHKVYVKQRPHLGTFLEKVAEMFEVIVFTASQSIYAAKLLDILDPDGKIISKRMYRESCIFTDGCYTKDLTVLGIDLAKVAIIDNSPQVFRFQVNNGIPIKSWFDDPSDNALISLLPFLETLVDTDDVRPVIAKRFGNKE